MATNEEYDSIKRQRTNAKRKFTRKTNAFFELSRNHEHFLVLKEKFEDIRDTFKELDKINDCLVSVVHKTSGHDRMEHLLDESDDYMREIESTLDKIRATYACHLPENSTRRSEIHVKPLDTPKFSGNIRDYASFKQDFNRLMTTNYGKDAYVLRSCLSGTALETIKGVEDNFEEMFFRLDKNFGDSRKFVDSVVDDLKSLQPIPEGNGKKFIEVVNVIERCWLDLKRMGIAQEMNTVSMISMIEKLLPTTQKREWILRVDSQGTIANHMFEELLQYLLQEKRVIEYMNRDIRTTAKSRNINHAFSDIPNDDTNENNEMKNKMRTLEESQLACQKQMLNDMERVAEKFERIVQVANFSKKPLYDQNRAYPSQSKWCWIHKSTGHSIDSCDQFIKMKQDEKITVMRQAGACFNCLQTGHIARDCFQRKGCQIVISGQICGKRHHSLLHNPNISHLQRQETIHSTQAQDKSTLLALSAVKCNDQNLCALWDSGADISLITHSAASQMNLVGSDVEISIVKVGNHSTTLKSKKYMVPLVDLDEKIWDVCAYGIDEITTDLQTANEDQIMAYFPEMRQTKLARPKGKVDLLIGVDCCIIMPNVVKTVGNLQLMKNQFGYCVRGSFSNAFQEHDRKLDKQSYKQLRLNNFVLNTNSMHINSTAKMNDIEDFFRIESLGTSCSPRCGGCRCGKCSMGMNDYTLKEERELSLIQGGLVYDEKKRLFTANYPWIKNPELLPNNEVVAKAKLRSTEHRLYKMDENRQQAYQNQMEDMERRGASRKLSKAEIRSYKGPIHYIHHHEVIKQNSTTPVRIVFNSSASYMGHVLNEYWAKGPDFVNNLYGILLRFREHPVAIIADISKMYNSIQLSERDQHVHRYLWRDLQTSIDPNHYVLTAVPFGDRPSGTIAMVALHTIADKNKDKYPKAAKTIKENSYVDDILQSVPSESDALSLAENIQDILAQGNFRVKHWIMSGSSGVTNSQVTLSKTKREKILGTPWEPETDHFTFEPKLNFSPKRGKTETGPNLTKENVTYAVPETLTRKTLLRQVASIYDPLGLITPFTLKGKILMRHLLSIGSQNTQVNWDEPVPRDHRYEWLAFFKDMFALGDLRFPRCIKPSDAVGEPTLVIFSDASSQAYGACAYAHWSLASGKWEAFLISAKNRIAPTRQLSIPRLELCAALVGCRLGQTIQKEMTYKFKEIVYIVDSIIVRSQIQKESYGFGTFVATRIAEIQEKSSPSQWWWTNGSHNPADMVTRPSKPEELGIHSAWQSGPSFLNGPKHTWPISQKPYEDELPDRTSVGLATVSISNEHDISKIIKITNFSRLDTLLRVTARVMRVAETKSLKSIGQPLNSEIMSKAENIWIKHAQKPLLENWQHRFRRLGPSLSTEGILVVGSRIAKWLKDNWNQNCFVLLPANHPLTELIIRKIHNRDHGGVESTLAKLQAKFWVPGGRRVIKKIKRQCVLCRKLLGQPNSQVMGQVIPERLQPSPPFYHTALDLFGPFYIKDTVKRRTKAKVYGVLFTCLASRATYIDVVEGYSTQDFLLAFRRFVTLRGYPATMYSDAGSQLTAANKELRDLLQELDIDELSHSGANHGLNWTFTKSSDSPWQNGCSEALIRLVKRALTITIGDSILTFSELQTVLFEIANLLNERPIGRKPGADPTAGIYLSPNDLLLGRTQITPPQGKWAENSRLADIFLFLQRIVTSFWKKWYRDYFESLLIRQKWHNKERNFRQGDVVLVQEHKPIRGKWKLAEVVSVEPSTDGNVRDVTLRYKSQTDGNTYTGQQDVIIKRPVQRLVLIIEADSRN